MPEKYDRLSFIFVKNKGNKTAHIRINGCSFIELLSFTETRIKELNDDAHTGNYNYLNPCVLYENLINAQTEGTYERENGAPLVCCKSCGDIYCWSVYALIERNENSVVWTLRHNHRNWDYGLKFCFEREKYDTELRLLRCYLDRITESAVNNP